MCKQRLILAVAVAFLCSILVGVSTATEYTPGVSKDDFFNYESKGYFYSNDPQATCPAYIANHNDTDWMRLVITNVTSDTVYTHTITHYKNGQESTLDGFHRWATGEAQGTVILAANMSVNDRVANASAAFTINYTEVKTYYSGPRETNIVNMTIVNGNITDNGVFYFDKLTGACVDFIDVISYGGTGYNTTAVQTTKLINTNVWAVSEDVIPEYSSIIFSILVISGSIGAIALKRKISRA